MRIVQVLLAVALFISLLANVIMYAKWGNRRSIISVNEVGITKRDVDDYLLQQAGPNVKAKMVQRLIVRLEAEKQGVAPSQADIDEEYNLQKEINWQFAQQVNNNPWIAGEQKNNIAEQLAMVRLRAKGVPVTDEEIKEEYAANPARYDTPNKAKVNLGVVTDASKVNDIKQLLSSTPPVSPTVIMTQYRSAVQFLGDDNKFTVFQPFGTNQGKDIFSMKPNEVKVSGPGQFQKAGAKALLVRMIEVIPGKKADLNDPKTKEKLRLQIAIRRAKPWQEIFSQLWADYKVKTENPQDLKYMEMTFFPDRAKTAAK
jgi:hypothetical protein